MDYSERRMSERSQSITSVSSEAEFIKHYQQEIASMQFTTGTSAIGQSQTQSMHLSMGTESVFAQSKPDSQYWLNGPGSNSSGSATDSLESFSYDYGTLKETPGFDGQIPRKPEHLRKKRYLGGRWNRLDAFLFIALNIAQVIMLVLAILTYLIFIPKMVESQVQKTLNGESSAFSGGKVTLKKLSLGMFRENYFPLEIAAVLPRVVPLLPISLTIGSITINAEVPFNGQQQIATVSTTPISVIVSQPLDIDTTVKISLDDGQQQRLHDFLASGQLSLDTTLTAQTFIPVKIFFIPIYQAMHITLQIQPKKILNANPGAIISGFGPSPLKGKVAAQNLLSIPGLGVDIRPTYLNLDVSNPGLGVKVNAELGNPLPIYLEGIPRFSGFVGIGSTKVLKFQAENLTLTQGIQDIGVGFKVHLLDPLIDAPQARQAIQSNFQKFASGSSDLGLSLCGPFEVEGSSFIQKTTNDFILPIPQSLLSGLTTPDPNSPLTQLFSNAGLNQIISMSDLPLHLTELVLSPRIVLPLFLPAPMEPFVIPVNVSAYISDPVSGDRALKLDFSQIGVSRNESNIIADLDIKVNPTGFPSLNNIENFLRLGTGFLAASQVVVQAQNLQLNDINGRTFDFFGSQLPIPQQLNNTVNLCDGCYARNAVFKVLSQVQLA